MENTQENQNNLPKDTAGSAIEQTAPSQAPAAPKNKPPFILFLLIALIIIFGSAIFIIQNKDIIGLPLNQANNQVVNSQATPTSAPDAVSTVTPQISVTMEEKEVDNVNIDEAVDADFQEVEKDIQELQGS